MGGQFDWQTDEEWTDEQPSLAPRPARNGWRITLLLTLAIVGGVSLFLAHRGRQLVQAENDRLVADVRAAYRLLEEAAYNRDEELFRHLLARRNEPWALSQQALVAEDLYFGREAFGLSPAGPPGAYKEARIALAPELTRAELAATYEYRAGGQGPAVALERTVTLQRAGSGWILAEPGPAFWGSTAITTTRHFTITFPTRDRAFVTQMRSALESMVPELCRLPDLACPDRFHLEVALSANPRSLLHSALLTPTLQAGETLTLPAPSLVGAPVGAQSAAALANGYAAHVAAALIARFVGYDCCDHGLLFQALLAVQWRQLGLREWPAQTEDYRRILRHAFSPASTGRFWETPFDARLRDDSWRSAYIIAEYLTGDLGLTAAALQRRMLRAGSPQYWLTPYAGTSFSTGDDEPWFRFVHAHAFGDQEAPDEPAQDVQLVCGVGRSFYRELQRYESGAERRYTEADYGLTNIQLWPLPGAGGVVVQEKPAPPDVPLRTVWYQNGRATPLFGEAEGDGAAEFTGVSDPAGRYLLMQTSRRSAGEQAYGLLDRTTCRAGACTLQPLAGRPTWSPSGERLILSLSAGDYPELWLAAPDGELQSKIAVGRLPFWLDNDRFGFVGEASIMATNGEGELYELLPLSELHVLAGFSTAGSITHVATYPGARARLLIVLADAAGGRNAMFHFEVASGALALLWQTDAGWVNRAEFSPTGRWLTADLQSDRRMRSTLYLYDLESGELTEYSSLFALPAGYDWSADGRWLLMTDSYMLHLIAPAEGYQVIHPYDANTTCYMAAWVAPG